VAAQQWGKLVELDRGAQNSSTIMLGLVTFEEVIAKFS
jgi:hypothetical protein